MTITEKLLAQRDTLANLLEVQYTAVGRAYCGRGLDSVTFRDACRAAEQSKRDMADIKIAMRLIQKVGE